MIAEITIRAVLLQITNQQEGGETKNQVVSSAKKRGRQRKSHESLGFIMADTKRERPCLGNKQGNQKKEKLPYLGSSNMEKENHLSSSDKLAEVIPNAADKVSQLPKQPLFGNKLQEESSWVTRSC